MVWQARGENALAEAWSRECARRDYALPRPGQDCSWNYAPCLRAGRGDWIGLGEALDHYWQHGWGNEFNSPLYTARVYTAVCLGALLHGDRDAWLRLHRWTAWLSLQAVAVGAPRRDRLPWDGRAVNVRPRRVGRTGIAIPCTGMRANVGSLGQPLAEPVLARVLGIEHRLRRDPGTLARDKAHWAQVGSPANPESLVETVTEAETRTGTRLAGHPWMQACRRAVEGDLARWDAIAARIRTEIVLPRGLESWVVQRHPGAVATAWSGTSPTRQKPSVAAALIQDGRRRTLTVAPWAIPTPQTTARIILLDGQPRRVRADAGDQSATMALLADCRSLTIRR